MCTSKYVCVLFECRFCVYIFEPVILMLSINHNRLLYSLFAEEQLINRTQTIKKPAVPLHTIAILKDLLAHEYDFYKFAKQRFYAQYEKIFPPTVKWRRKGLMFIEVTGLCINLRDRSLGMLWVLEYMSRVCKKTLWFQYSLIDVYINR